MTLQLADRFRVTDRFRMTGDGVARQQHGPRALRVSISLNIVCFPSYQAARPLEAADRQTCELPQTLHTVGFGTLKALGLPARPSA